MTISELFAKGVRQFRDPKWNEQAYLEFTYVDEAQKLHGPVLRLVDPPGQEAMNIPIGSQELLHIYCDGDGWEEFMPQGGEKT